MRNYYITTPIYYINAEPHIGHAYTAIVADIFARYHRMNGEDVFFLTGTDENSQKNVEAAEKRGMEDDVEGYLDQMAAQWQETFDTLNLTHDRFIRTTEDDHKKAVEKFWKTVEDSGDIYKDTYEGLYCTGCEAFVSEGDLDKEGNCPDHGKPPETIKEENYFFKLTNYRDELLEYIGKQPDFVLPEARRNEIVSYIRDFMEDISISRASVDWGIPVPGDEEQKIYVWFDALINYLTGIGYGTDQEKFEKMWPANLHLVGKDIIKFHCALWPAMLMSAGLELPNHVFAHGFFTINGKKMSKTLGNVIDPTNLATKYGNDPLRYFFVREIHLGEDGNFSEDRLRERYAGDLANEFGNLAHRVLSMVESYCDGEVPDRADGHISSAWQAYDGAMERMLPHEAMQVLWNTIKEANRFVEQEQPWELNKLDETKRLNDVMYVLLETLRHIGWMAYPFMPETSRALFEKLNVDVPKEFSQSFAEAWKWGELEPGTKIEKGDPLFPPLDTLE
jgi:methionyl-tRNA synthetase